MKKGIIDRCYDLLLDFWKIIGLFVFIFLTALAIYWGAAYVYENILQKNKEIKPVEKVGIPSPAVLKITTNRTELVEVLVESEKYYCGIGSYGTYNINEYMKMCADMISRVESGQKIK